MWTKTFVVPFVVLILCAVIVHVVCVCLCSVHSLQLGSASCDGFQCPQKKIRNRIADPVKEVVLANGPDSLVEQRSVY